MINLNLVLSFLSPSIFFKHIPFFLKNLLFLVLLQSPLKAQGLADTGQTLCNTGPNGIGACSQATTGDSAIYPAQDGRYGRDAAAQAGILVKVGGGHAGFDYTKVCNSGEKEGSGACLINPSLGNGDNDWGCSYDNITERLWEVKTNNGNLRHNRWTYSLYNTGNNSNGGDVGTENNGRCVDSSNCDTEKYTTQVNITGLCGFSDWRLPQPQELMSLFNSEAMSPGIGSPRSNIDINYFPNTQSSDYWAASSYVPNPTNAWFVRFNSGGIYAGTKSDGRYVRLVRGGQLFDPLLEICDANNANTNTFVNTPSHDFIQNGAIVIHKSTGLTWDRCSLGQAWHSNFKTCGVSINHYSWENALKEIKIRNNALYLGFSDWRLPNLKELGSIVESCGYNPAINPVIFPNTESSNYWSASFFIPNSGLAWSVKFDLGNTESTFISSDYEVRLVRGGQSFDFLNPIAAPPSLTSETYNNNHLFELAENKFSEFFTPSKSKTLILNNWEYRYYSGTDTYLGILSENETYVLGGTFGSEIVRVGFRNELIDLLAK